MVLFSPTSALVGGFCIGLSASLLLLVNGDILGASLIAKSLIRHPVEVFENKKWMLAFAASFFLTSISCLVISPKELIVDVGSPSAIVSSTGFIVSGFLVGCGTTLGNGCTTGHGICGLARRSKRSFVAVIAFMSAGVFGSTISSPSFFLTSCLRTTKERIPSFYPTIASTLVGVFLTTFLIGAACYSTYVLIVESKQNQVDEEERGKDESTKLVESKGDHISFAIGDGELRKFPAAIVSAAIFSFGLNTSGMTENHRIIGFLDLKGFVFGTWDPTLAFVMGGGLLVSALGYEFVPGYNLMLNNRNLSYPFSQSEDAKFILPNDEIVDKNLVIGEVLFGLGWGIGGYCPGPAIFAAAVGYPSVLFQWWPAYWVGSAAASYIVSRQ